MRLLTILFLIAVTAEGRKRRPDKKRTKMNQEISKTYDRRDFLRLNNSNFDLDFNGDVTYSRPVPFGHIFKDGYEDPTGDYKQPVDLLELHTLYLRDGPFARDLIKSKKKKFQVVTDEDNMPRVNIVPPPVNTLPPPVGDKYSPDANGEQRIPFDQAILGEEITNSRKFEKSPHDDNDTIIPYWNLEAILKRNIAEPPKYRLGGGKRPKPGRKPDLPSDYAGKAGYFAKNSYALYEEPKKKSNSTTCDEFGKHAKFHPNDIVNIDWVPFYVWTDEVEGKVTVSRVHHFKYPTKKLVKQYKDNFGPYLIRSVDWEQPKLYLKAHTVESLLIAVDRTGLFDAIPFYQLSPTPQGRSATVIPIMTLRLKIVDPYLALMFCSLDYATLMAVSGTEPRTYEKCVSESAALKFKGPGLPIRRDFQAEANQVRRKMMDDARREEEKYIKVEDQMAAAGL